MSDEQARIDASAPLPRLLGEFELLSGSIKGEYEDFYVDEIPLYPADGHGTHTYFLLDKRGLTTLQAIHDIAAALGVMRHDIGYAGLKDARAVTRQWMSIEHTPPERLLALELPRIQILKTTLHGNKLRLGHLKGNRFRIRVRNASIERLGDLRNALDVLAKRGVPNYFGAQRFGSRGDSGEIGRALLHGDVDGAIDLVLGRPNAADHGRILEARKLYDTGNFEQAAKQWPGMYRDERRALKALAQSKGNRRRALAAIDRNLRRFYLSAYQSQVFNAVVAARMPHGLDRVMTGDYAFVHFAGAVFHVDDAEREQSRAISLEISPTGPLFGYRMSEPDGVPGEIETSVMRREKLDELNLRDPRMKLKGARRPLRFPVHDPEAELGADGRGTYLELRFGLPRGCYATTLLRELFRDAAGVGSADTDEDDAD